MLKISSAFAAGVLLVLLTGASEPLAALSMGGCLGAMAYMTRSSRFETGAVMVSFFLAGVFCHCSARLSGTVGSFDLQALTGNTITIMERAIDHVPFSDKRTAALLKALLCGDRGSMSRDIVAAFRQSGASHILALSGLHLGLIYLIVKTMLGILGNTPAAWASRSILCIALCGFYALATGASPSIVRAFLFILLRELGSLFPGRSHSPATIYCTALTIHLILNPAAIESPGFQLSYLAMAGIYTIFPKMKAWFPASQGFNPVRKIWELAALSISCQLFTAPAAWFHFHTFPQFFLLTNLLSLPLTEALIISGLFSILFTIILPLSPLTLLLSNLTDLLSRLLISTLSAIASLPAL